VVAPGRRAAHHGCCLLSLIRPFAQFSLAFRQVIGFRTMPSLKGDSSSTLPVFGRMQGPRGYPAVSSLGVEGEEGEREEGKEEGGRQIPTTPAPFLGAITPAIEVGCFPLRTRAQCWRLRTTDELLSFSLSLPLFLPAMNGEVDTEACPSTGPSYIFYFFFFSI